MATNIGDEGAPHEGEATIEGTIAEDGASEPHVAYQFAILESSSFRSIPTLDVSLARLAREVENMEVDTHWNSTIIPLSTRLKKKISRGSFPFFSSERDLEFINQEHRQVS